MVEYIAAHWLEILGSILGGLSVFYLWRNRAIPGWGVFGISNSLLYAWVMFDAKLFGDVILNVFYFFTCIWALYTWYNAGQRKLKPDQTYTPVEKAPLPIRNMGKREWALTAVVVAVVTLVGGQIFTPLGSDVAYIDMFTTGGSIAAQVLLWRKFYQNWYIWIFCNFIDIGLYIAKDLKFVAATYVVYTFFCIMALRDWRKRQDREQETGIVETPDRRQIPIEAVVV